MTEKERELRQLHTSKMEEARSLFEAGKLDEANAVKTEIETIKAQIEGLRSLDGITVPAVTPPAAVKEVDELEEEKRGQDKQVDDKVYRSAYEKFLKYGKAAEMTTEERNAFRSKQSEVRAMVENDAAAGGNLVPVDDEKEIIKQKKSKRSIRNLVAVKPVSTLTGSRPKRRGTDLKLRKTNEKAPIGARMDTPEYNLVEYKVKKYTGMFEGTNEMYDDSAVSVSAELNDWFTEISLNTENDEVFNGVGGADSCQGIFTSTEYPTVAAPAELDIKTLRKLKNKVDAQYRSNAKWVMNTQASEVLADIKYADGRSVLVENPSKADTFTLFGFPVEIYDEIATTTNKTKIAFGNFEVGYYFFDRKGLQVKITDEGSDAFENDTTLTRVIQRFDGKPANTDAIAILTGVTIPAE